MTASASKLLKKGPQLSVGILSADLLNLRDEIQRLEALEVGALHFDILDGQFGWPLTVGPAFAKAVKTRIPKDVHLMVKEPESVVADYIAAGAQILTVQIESLREPASFFADLAKSHPDLVRGVALLPRTPIDFLLAVLESVDLVLLLSVDPTTKPWTTLVFGDVQRRFAQARALCLEKGRELLFVADGGIKLSNIDEFATLNPNIVVSGSALFEKNELEKNVASMKKALTSAHIR